MYSPEGFLERRRAWCYYRERERDLDEELGLGVGEERDALQPLLVDGPGHLCAQAAERGCRTQRAPSERGRHTQPPPRPSERVSATPPPPEGPSKLLGPCVAHLALQRWREEREELLGVGRDLQLWGCGERRVR